MSIQTSPKSEMDDDKGNASVEDVTEEELYPVLGDHHNHIINVAPRVKVQTGSGWFGSAFLVVNAALGAGLLNFPQAYHEAGGVLTAILVQSFFLVFVVVAIMILGYCSDIKKTNTYQDVVDSVCGPWGRVACALCIALYCFGTCITFLIIIGDQWESFFLGTSKHYYCTENPIFMRREFTICVTCILFVLPLCFPRRIDFLKYVSVIGVLGILYVVALVTVKYCLPFTEPDEIATSPKSWMDVFLVVPEICFAYQCHVSIIPIYSCLEKRNLKEFSKTVSLAMVLCVLTYTVTAAFGYLQFGAAITSDVLLSFDPDTSVMIAVILIAIKTYTTYPILLFCGRAGFDALWTMGWKMDPAEIERTERRRRIVTTLIWFAITLFLAVLIPNIGVVIQVLGAFAAIFIFIFPGICLLKSMQDLLSTGEEQPRRVYYLRAFAISFIVIGAFIFGLTLAQALLKDIKGVSADKSKYTCEHN